MIPALRTVELCVPSPLPPTRPDRGEKSPISFACMAYPTSRRITSREANVG